MRFCFFGWSIQNNILVMIFIHCFESSGVRANEQKQRRNKDKNQKNTKKQNSKRKNGEKGEMRV